MGCCQKKTFGHKHTIANNTAKIVSPVSCQCKLSDKVQDEPGTNFPTKLETIEEAQQDEVSIYIIQYKRYVGMSLFSVHIIYFMLFIFDLFL